MDKMYPLTPLQCAAIDGAVVGIHVYYGDWSGLVKQFTRATSLILNAPYDEYAAVGLLGASTVIVLLKMHKCATRRLLSRHGWMFDPLGKPSLTTKVQIVIALIPYSLILRNRHDAVL